jgi:hypothetical protein
MRVASAIAASTLLVACGSSTSRQEDAREGDKDAGVDDASLGSDTMVTGMLAGTPFVLTHADVAWPSGDSRTWICASNEVVSVASCLDSSGPDRIVLYGPFIVQTNGSGVWVAAQVGLYRVGANPSSDIATAADMNLVMYSAKDHTLAMTATVEFADNGTVSGTIRFP